MAAMTVTEQDQPETSAGPDWGPRGSAAATIAARLSFEGVSHRFAANDVVRDVDLDLAPGEIVCLLGPSGCGKTTLLRIGAGVERPSSGKVLLDGREMASDDVFVPPENRSIGLMFQDFALFPHLTIIENVLFGLKGLARDQALTEARATLNRVGMTDYETAYPHMLSGGEQQRIALARAIAPRPAVLLMDEPFSGLDRRLRVSVRAETLAVLKETRASALMVTHDPEEALGMADRIALMRAGRIIQSGTPFELYTRPNSAAVARMFSSYNEIGSDVKSGQAVTPLGNFAAKALSDGDRALVLVRHEAFRIGKSRGSFKALVTATRFMGDSHYASLLVDGLDEPLSARLFGRKVPKSGDIVDVSIDKSQAFVFPEG
jgi:iron(III) transport system ATP-binding protein